MKRPQRLSDAFVERIKEPGRYGDGRGGYGLSLLVKSRKDGSLSKTFSQRLTVGGKPKQLGLGAYPIVTLDDARAQALENARLVRRSGFGKPSTLVQAIVDAAGMSMPSPVHAQPVMPALTATPYAAIRMTFKEAAEQVIELNRPNWKQTERRRNSTAHQWEQSLTDYVYPRIGDMPINEITSAEILAVLTPIWNTKRETADRVRTRIEKIFHWAKTAGHCTDNPAIGIKSALPNGKRKQKHMKALPHAFMADAVGKVQDSGIWDATKNAFLFLTLTATRNSEVRLATWSEIDLKRRTWTLTPDRVGNKSGREHRIPLSRQAIALLESLEGEREGLIFPNERDGGPITINAFSRVCMRLELGFVPHGIRSSFRDWAAEMTDKPREAAEMCLGHIVGTQVELAYRRTDYYNMRVELMQDWADYIMPM